VVIVGAIWGAFWLSGSPSWSNSDAAQRIEHEAPAVAALPVTVASAPPKADVQEPVARQPLRARRPSPDRQIAAAKKTVELAKPQAAVKAGTLLPSKPAAKSQSHPRGAPQPAAPVAIALPVVPKAQAKDSDLRALETAANHATTAEGALALYKHFAATRTMTDSQQANFRVNLQVWKDRAKQNLVRLGDKWVPEAQALQARKEAAQLVKQAYGMIGVLNYEEARKTLERASRVDPNSITADFTLGILYSLINPPERRNPKAAERHFQTVVHRAPGYVPALNNVALAQLRQEKYPEAVRNLSEAADRSPTTDEVRHNVARFLGEATLKRLRPRKTALSSATKIYAKVDSTTDGTPSDRKYGWRYIPLVSPKDERESLSSVQTPETDPGYFIAQGTGFVVEPHYVLACRHVVDDLTLGPPEKIELIDPADPSHSRRLSAACVDLGQDDDLCLLRCDELEAPPIPLADHVPTRGTQIALIGFPRGSSPGLGLKTMRGLVTALPGDVSQMGAAKWFDFSRRVWYDAASNHGASGGAVCDERGNAVAIDALSYRLDNDASTAKNAPGVPAPYAATFIRAQLRDFSRPPTAGPPLKWTEVNSKVSPSVVLIVAGYRKIALQMNPPNAEGARNSPGLDAYDDHVCSACNGSGRMKCPGGCLGGFVHGERFDNQRINIGSANSPIWTDNVVTTPTRTPCRTCGGTGRVQCPFCANGVDPNLN
jgi:S1-C subfamily serine protease